MGKPSASNSDLAPLGAAPLSEDARVLVVGAGHVGQTAALLLARYGIPVTLLEARRAREPAGSRSICQHRDVLDVWSWCGAGPWPRRD